MGRWDASPASVITVSLRQSHATLNTCLCPMPRRPPLHHRRQIDASVWSDLMARKCCHRSPDHHGSGNDVGHVGRCGHPRRCCIGLACSRVPHASKANGRTLWMLHHLPSQQPLFLQHSRECTIGHSRLAPLNGFAIVLPTALTPDHVAITPVIMI